MKIRMFVLSTLAAFTALAGNAARADNLASLAITPATGAVTLTPRWAIGGNLAGFHLMAQDLSLGGGANNFYSIKSTPIPDGGDIAAFTYYIAASGSATNHQDIGSKLTPDSYSALTSADPDVGYGPVNLYLIHHKSSGDYFTVIVPSSATASAVTDLKPMSGPGGPATLGASGYFGLTFAAANLGYGLDLFYYLRTDPGTGFTVFGTLDPALLGTAGDQFNLGAGGYNALTFTGSDVGFGINQMYYDRLDPVTGFTILGTLDPLTGQASDIANLGSVFSTLDFVPGDVGFGPGQFYVTGAIDPTWQSVSFAAIADRAIGAGSFTVAPTASSGLAVTLEVVVDSVGAASISGPVDGVFTVTPTAPGLITLQATQAGVAGTVESNMLRQSFTASGGGVPVITNSPLIVAGTIGAPFSFTITASNSPTSFTADPLPAGLGFNATTGVIDGTPTAVGNTNVQLGATNASGPGSATLTIMIVAAITTQPADAAATQGNGAAFTVVAEGSGLVTYQWQLNGVDLPGATSANLTIGSVQPADVGFYTVVVSSNGTTTTTVPASLAMLFTGKVVGSAEEVGASIHHPNGNIYDQFLLTGTAASVKATAGHIARISYVDLTDDIVQVEFSGAGTLTLDLAAASGPASPVNYDQPGVVYMKGHASIAVTGADATTNVAVFSVGRSNAVNQTLFRAGTNYDGWADIALVTVAGADGAFGGLRTANASYFSDRGMTGVYAPRVQFNGPLFVSDVDATDNARAYLVTGSVADARITGGDLLQDGGGDVDVSGITLLHFTAGTSSDGVLLPAQTNRGVLVEDGVDVTDQLVPVN